MEQSPKYYIVEASALPEIFQKVAEAKRMLETGETDKVNVAAQAAVISAPRQIFFISKAFPPKKAGTDLKFAAESCIVTTI